MQNGTHFNKGCGKKTKLFLRHKVRIVLEKSELTETLSDVGLSPGRNIIVKKSDGKTYDIETEESTLSLDSDLAAKIILQN